MRSRLGQVVGAGVASGNIGNNGLIPSAPALARSRALLSASAACTTMSRFGRAAEYGECSAVTPIPTTPSTAQRSAALPKPPVRCGKVNPTTPIKPVASPTRAAMTISVGTFEGVIPAIGAMLATTIVATSTVAMAPGMKPSSEPARRARG